MDIIRTTWLKTPQSTDQGLTPSWVKDNATGVVHGVVRAMLKRLPTASVRVQVVTLIVATT